MLHAYPGEKLRALRKRARLSQEQVKELTGIYCETLRDLEHDRRQPQSGTLERLLNLYAIRIKKFEHYEQIWAGTPQAAAARSVSSPGVVKGDGVGKAQGQPLPSGDRADAAVARREFSDHAARSYKEQRERLWEIKK